MPLRRNSAFTLVELIAAIAIVAILVAVMVPTVGNFVRQSRETADRQTLAVLNDAINRYKMQGGDVSALTQNISKTALLNLLSTPITWHGVTHQFIQNGQQFDTSKPIAASGSENSFYLTQFGSYFSTETGERIFNPFNKTGLLSWYDFDDVTDAHSGHDLAVVGSLSFSGGTMLGASGGNYASVDLYSQGFADAYSDYSYTVRAKAFNTTTEYSFPLYRRYRESIRYVSDGSGIRVVIGYQGNVVTNESTPEQWYTITAVYNYSQNKTLYYLDGNLIESKSPINPSGASGLLYFNILNPDLLESGGTPAEVGSTDIELSYAGFFTRALTDEEVLQLYNGGTDTQYSDL